MIRRIVVIDEEKCSGCGKCAEACHENAIGMIDGKARLLRDDYCDGLGDCLPACPAGAISFVEREAVPYDEAAVRENQMRLKMLADKQTETAHNSIAAPCGCPGTAAHIEDRRKKNARVCIRNKVRTDGRRIETSGRIEFMPWPMAGADKACARSCGFF